jgi:hypothetical protein
MERVNPDGSPWVGGVQAAATTRERARTSRRVLERFVILMLLATLGVSVVAALPAVVHLFEPTPPTVAARGIERVTRARGWAVGPPEPAPHPAFSPEDYEGRARTRDLLEELAPPIEPMEPAQPVGAMAKHNLVLRDRADTLGETVAEVSRGQMLLVLQDAGDWMLVAIKSEDRMRVGWVQKTELDLIR